MHFNTERQALREVFFRAWHNYREGHALEGIERIVADVARRHPEYHAVLENPQDYQERDYLPEAGETNPFLHMALHVAIQEQLETDRPPGVCTAYQALRTRLGDEHAVEHRMMDCLAQTLWQAQRAGDAPADNDYLACLRRHARR